MDYNRFIIQEKIKELKIELQLCQDEKEKTLLKIALIDLEN